MDNYKVKINEYDLRLLGVGQKFFRIRRMKMMH